MATFLIVLIVLTSIVLTFFVLIQNPKGGGLSSGFSGGSSLMGVQRTGDFLEKGTWTCVILLIVFSLAINIVGFSGSSSSGTLSDQIEAPAAAPRLNLNPNAGQEAAPQAAPTTSTDTTK